MKYRIMTDGDEFFIQYKWGFIWEYRRVENSQTIKPFSTEDEAVDFAIRSYGCDAKRVRKMRVV